MPKNSKGVNTNRGKKRAKKRKISDESYIRVFKSLKSKDMVAFGHNLRFNKKGELINKKIDPSIKRKITRAWNEAGHKFKNATYVPIPKKKGESKSHYKRRLRAIKKEHGQHQSFNGLLMYPDPLTELTFKNGKLQIKPYLNARNQFMEMIYIADPKLSIYAGQSELDDFESFTECVKNHMNANINERSIHSIVHFYYGHAYTGQGVDFIANNESFVDEAVLKMIEMLGKLVSNSGEEATTALSGLVIKHFIPSESY